MSDMKNTHFRLVLLFLLGVCSPAHSVSEFEQWRQQQQQSFQQYRDERDREFTVFLQEHWREIELIKGFVRDDRPKPLVIPVAKPEPVRPIAEPEPETRPVEKTVKPLPVTAVPDVVVPLKPLAVPTEERKGLRVQVNYFGTPITFYCDPALRKSLPNRINASVISEFWSGLSKTGYEPLLQQLNRQKTALRLNDWGYAVLLHKLAEQLYPSSDNQQVLLTWFMMAKSGYSSRIAFDDRNVYLLVPSMHRIYDVTYFTFDNERYYAVNFDAEPARPGKVYTYDGHYPGAVNKMDMTIRTSAAKTSEAQSRLLSFEFGGRLYEIEAGYDKAYVDFLDTYPQLDLEVYFESEVAESAESPLLQQLAKEIEGMSELEAVNFLLRFVQTSLQYKTDERQFGRENYLFPEETIYYDYSDCEDRSVLFAWLIKRLLGMEVVGLNYPGHVATAVHIMQNEEGDYVTYNGKRYTVTDPTYINATAGMTMPEFRNTRPNVIPIN
jgi:hypothetical protein